MEVQCPQCTSRFNLPDSLGKPGARLRCSVCKHVFTLPGSRPTGAAERKDKPLPRFKEPRPNAQPGPRPGLQMGKGRLVKLLLAVLLLCALGGGAYWYFFLRGMPEAQGLPGEDLARKVEMLTMRNVRQYIVENEKVGKVFVIEGRVVNEFPTPKALIAVQAAIYDKDRKVLSEKKQWAGTQLSLFQLQVLSQKEMESFLGNKLEILTNNTNVRQGGEVPFMVLFYDPPTTVAEFGVKIVDVQDASPQE